jgi:hypothetical protein
MIPLEPAAIARCAPCGGRRSWAICRRLEHIPKKLIDFFEKDMLQLYDFERVLVDWMIPSNRNTL